MYRARRLGLVLAGALLVQGCGASHVAAPQRPPAPASTVPITSPTTQPLVSVPPSTRATFPLTLSSDHRYLVDHSGKPFRVQGDAAWDAPVNMTLSDWQSFLDDQRARGFNTVQVQITNPVKYIAESHAPGAVGAGGALPFLKNASGGSWDGDPAFANDMGQHDPPPGNFDAAFSSPNPAYFNWIRQMVQEANKRGVLMMMTVSYFGYNLGKSGGWWPTMVNQVNTQAVSYQFGKYLGNEFKDLPNIVWEQGADTFPPPGSDGEARALKMLEGIRAAGDTHLWTGEWSHDYLSTDSAAFAPNMDIEGVYTHGPYPKVGPTYGRARLAYSHTPALPSVLLETNYEGEHGASLADIRYFMWGAELSAIGGEVFGTARLWPIPPDWRSDVDTPGAHDMTRLGTLLDSLPWYQLVPSGLEGMKKLITAGGGKYTSIAGIGAAEVGGMNWIVSAATPDGHHLLAYVPSAHHGSFSVDMTAMVGSAHAQWYDPTSGVLIDAGSFSNIGKHSFAIPGPNSEGSTDWVLELTA